MSWSAILFWASLVTGAVAIWWGTRKPRKHYRDTHDWRRDQQWRSWM